MKSSIACCVVLVLAACSSSSSTTSTSSTNGTTGGSGSPTSSGTTTGAKTTTGGAAGTTGGAAGTTGGTTGSTLGSTCTVTAGVDSCTAAGYECTAEFSTATPATCVLPEEIGVCLPSVGCQDGGVENLVCSTGFQNSGTGQMLDLCVYPCTTTADCSSESESCIQVTQTSFVCFLNQCTEDNPPDVQTCPAQDAGDGECLSLDGEQEFLCFQDGLAGIGQQCQLTRDQGGTNCGYGDLCVPNAGQDGGLCYQITVDGTCPDAGDAVQLSTAEDFGICAPDCTASGVCVTDGGPAGLIGFGTCQSLGATSACLP